MLKKFIIVVLVILVSVTISYSADEPVQKIRIVAFGDSITAGFGATAYSVYLQQILNANNCNSIVINEGKSGEQTTEGVKRIDSVIAKHKPNFILIMEGANDARSGVSAEVTAANLGTMMDKAVAAGVIPKMSSITPNTEGGTENKAIPEVYNPKIQQQAANRGVSFVDNYSALAGPSWPSYNYDGLHMTNLGQNVIAQEFYNSIPCGSTESSSGGGGGCFIATAAYGSLLEPHVALLREFRDSYLLTNVPGRIFVDFYYTYSPPVAEVIAQNEILKLLVRIALLPLIGFAFIMVHGFWYLMVLGVLIPAFYYMHMRKSTPFAC